MWQTLFSGVFIYALSLYIASIMHFGFQPALISLERHGENLSGLYEVVGYSVNRCNTLCILSVNVRSLNFDEQFKLKWYNPPNGTVLNDGEHWFLEGRYAYPQGYRNTGVPNPQWRYSAAGLSGDLKLQQGCCYRMKAAQGFAAFKNGLRQLLVDHTPLHAQGIVLALVLGDKSALITPVYDSFAYFGLSHILAVSGMHIGIAAGLGFFIARLIWRLITMLPPTSCFCSINRFALEFICCVLLALGYALLSGFSPSAQRALVMLFIMMGARFIFGEAKWLLAYQIAFVAVVCMNPYAGADTGFWLSFIAVGLLILLCFDQREADSRWSLAKSLIKSQLLLTFGLFFLTVRWQGALSLLSVPLNLLIVPLLASIIMPAIFISLILLYCGIEWPYFTVVNLLEQATLGLVHLHTLKPLHFKLPSSSAFLFLSAVSVLIWARTSLRPLLPLCLIFAVLSYWVQREFNHPLSGEFEIHVMDAGQGTSIVIQTRNHVILYDTGPGWGDDFSVMEYNLQHYFRLNGIDTFDLVVVSHEDSDHAGGLAFLLKHNIVHKFVTSFPFSAPLKTNLNTSLCDRRHSWWLDGVLFELLPSFSSQNSNDRSCILKVSNQSLSLLMPGDIGVEVEQYWALQAPRFLDADVLIAPHHGSKTSSSTGFINRVNPELVVFTASLPSRFNHPHPDVVGRYLVRHVKSYQTGGSGVLRISSEDRRTKHIFLD